ncbi:hypothetical protein MRX96_020832 [Rhipicephalus microplus]
MPVSPRPTDDKARFRIRSTRTFRENIWPFLPILDSPRYLVCNHKPQSARRIYLPRLQKPSSLRSQLGHATAASMAFKLSLFMQVLLSWSATLPLSFVNTEACPFRLVPQTTRPVSESVNADIRENIWPFLSILDSTRYLVWQPQATISAADLSARLQKPSSLRSQLGHATAASMAFKLSLFMQVLLSWSATLPLSFVNTEACPFRLVPQTTRPVSESVNADIRENIWPFLPILDSPRYLTTRPVSESVNADIRENIWPFLPILDSPRYLVCNHKPQSIYLSDYKSPPPSVASWGTLPLRA